MLFRLSKIVRSVQKNIYFITFDEYNKKDFHREYDFKTFISHLLLF